MTDETDRDAWIESMCAGAEGQIGVLCEQFNEETNTADYLVTIRRGGRVFEGWLRHGKRPDEVKWFDVT